MGFNSLFADYQDWLGPYTSSSPSSWIDFVYAQYYSKIVLAEKSDEAISAKPLFDMYDYLSNLRFDEERESCVFSSTLEDAYSLLKTYLSKVDRCEFEKYYTRNSDDVSLEKYGYTLYLYGVTKFFDLCDLLSEDSYFQEVGLDTFGCVNY